MTTNRTERGTVTLAELVRREMGRRKWSLRDTQAHTGVSRNALNQILKEETGVPTLETLYRLGDAFGVPLWRMVELAGYTSGIVPDNPQGQIERVIKLSQSMPQLAVLLDQVLELPPGELNGVLAYLEALNRRRGDAGLDPGEPAQ